MLLMLLALALQDPSRADGPHTTPLEDIVIEGRADPVRGRVRLECEVRTDGRLEDCRILSETPEGAGFGAAALSGASRARVPPNRRGGRAVNERVTFDMTFVPSDDAGDDPNP